VKGITGRPTAGARLVLEKAEEEEGIVIYRGFVHRPDADVPVEARVALVHVGGGPPKPPGSSVVVTLGEGGDAETEKWAAALVRAATKGAADRLASASAGATAPRKIVRWRG
jgi:hypothetical protein